MTYHNFSFNTLAIDTDSLVVNYKPCPNKLPASLATGIHYSTDPIER